MQSMQQTLLRDRNAAANRTGIARLNAGYALNVALVHQDALTSQWAGQVRDLMAEVAGPEAVHCTEWKIGDLIEPKVCWPRNWPEWGASKSAGLTSVPYVIPKSLWMPFVPLSWPM